MIKLAHINITKFVLLLFALLPLIYNSSNAAVLLEQKNNELAELKQTNTTKANDINNNAHKIRNLPKLRNYYAPSGFGGNGGYTVSGVDYTISGVGGFPAGYSSLPGCPLCDASVYSYCSERLFHDECCCNFPVLQYRPPQCYFADCTLFFAKSCYEHSLIKNCCCNTPY